MASIYTTADRDAVKAALITAATEGVASVSVGGHSATSYSLVQLRSLLKEICQDLASDCPSRGLRITKLVPGGTG